MSRSNKIRIMKNNSIKHDDNKDPRTVIITILTMIMRMRIITSNNLNI